MKLIITIAIIILLLLLWFYRHPLNRNIFKNRNIIYSPAYGRILKVQYLKGDKIHIAIFLSPYDIHRQYIPISGRVKKILYDRTGKFNIAYKFNKSNKNEKFITILDTDRGDVIIYQIAGILVRRISNYMRVGEYVDTGVEMGIIHFGSRVDITIPNASSFNLLVNEGEYMRGINSKIGYYIR
jgi:phosphatidylserine decarboxylase